MFFGSFFRKIISVLCVFLTVTNACLATITSADINRFQEDGFMPTSFLIDHVDDIDHLIDLINTNPHTDPSHRFSLVHLEKDPPLILHLSEIERLSTVLDIVNEGYLCLYVDKPQSVMSSLENYGDLTFMKDDESPVSLTFQSFVNEGKIELSSPADSNITQNDKQPNKESVKSQKPLEMAWHIVARDVFSHTGFLMTSDTLKLSYAHDQILDPTIQQEMCVNLAGSVESLGLSLSGFKDVFSDLEVGSAGLIFEAISSVQPFEMTCYGDINCNVSFKTQNIASLKIGNSCDFVLKGAADTSLEKMDIFGSFIQENTVQTDSFNTNAILHLYKGSVFHADYLKIVRGTSQSRVSRTMIVDEDANFSVDFLDQYQNPIFLNNSGYINVQSGTGMLHLTHNSGFVKTGLNVLETISNTRPDRNIAITGSISTPQMVFVKFNGNNGEFFEDVKTINWKQSISAYSIVIGYIEGLEDSRQCPRDIEWMPSIAPVKLTLHEKACFQVNPKKGTLSIYTDYFKSKGTIQGHQLTYSGKKFQGTRNIETPYIKVLSDHIVFSNDVTFKSLRKLILQGKNIGLNTAVIAQKTIKLHASEKLALYDSIKSNQGYISLEGDEFEFPQNKPITIEGQNVYCHKKMHLRHINSSHFVLPSSIQVKVNPNNGVFFMKAPQHSVSLYSNHQGYGLKVECGSFELIPYSDYSREYPFCMKCYDIESCHKTQLKAKIVNAIRGHIDTRSLFINGDVNVEDATFKVEDIAHISSVSLSTKTATLQARDAFFDHSTLNGSILLEGRQSAQAPPDVMGQTTHQETSVFVLDSVNASLADIEQRNNNLYLKGHTKIRSLKTNQSLASAPDSYVELDHLETGATTKVIDLKGKVDTKQRTLSLAAQKRIFLKNLNRVTHDGLVEAFETLRLQSDVIHVEGNLKAQQGDIFAREDLCLQKAALMGHVFALLSGDVLNVKNTTIKGSQISVQAHDIDITQSDLHGNAVDLKAEGVTTLNHTPIHGNSVDLKAEGVTLNHTSIHANSVDLKAKTAIFDPRSINSKRISVALSSYQNGIEGVLKLAHDLVNCESVHLDAKNETLILERPTTWRPNISLCLDGVSILNSLTSSGHIHLDAHHVEPVRCDFIKAQSFSLMARQGDLNFYKVLIDVLSDLKLTAQEGCYRGLENTYKAGQNLEIHGKQGVFEEARAIHHGGGENFHESLQASSYHAGQDIRLTSDVVIDLTSLTAEAGGDLSLKAGHIHTNAIGLASRHVYHSKRRVDIYYDVVHQLTRLKAGGKVSIHATDGTAILEGTHIEANDGGGIYGEGGIALLDKHDIHEHTVITKKKERNFGFLPLQTLRFLGPCIATKRVTTVHTTQQSRGVSIDSGKTFQVISPANIRLVGSKIRAPIIVLQSLLGEIEILQGQNFESTVRQMKWDNMIWSRMKSEAQTSLTHNPCMFVGETHIFSPKVIIQEVNEAVHQKTVKKKTTTRTESVAPQYNIIGCDAELNVQEFIQKREAFKQGCVDECLRVNELNIHGGDIVHQYLKNRFTTDLQRTSGPGVLTQVLVSLALSIVTGGAAATLMAVMSNAMWNAVYAAAITSILSCEGDLGAATKSFANSDTLKNIVAAGATAGLTHGIGAQLGVNMNPKGFVQHVQYGALKTAVSTGVNFAIHQECDIQSVVRNFAASTAGSYLSEGIGEIYQGGNGLPCLVHKALHGVKGAVEGGIANGVQGMGPGAFGAAVSESIAEFVFSPTEQQQMRMDIERGLKTEADYHHRLDVAMNTARVTTVLTAALAGMQDPDQIYQALASCNTSLEYNYLQYVAAVLTGAYIGITLSDITRAYEEGGWEAVLKVCQVEAHAVMVYKNAVNGASPIISACAGAVGAVQRIVYKVGGRTFETAEAVYAFIIKSYPKLAQFSKRDFFGCMHKQTSLVKEIKTAQVTVQNACTEAVENTISTAAVKSNVNPRKFTSDVFTKQVTWTAPTGTKQTYKVTQRNDIDWNMVRTAGVKRFVGKTNAEAAKAGFAPQLNDGHFATLHHLGQDSRGGLVEASRRYHGVDKGKVHDIIHSIYGRNRPHPNHPVDHKLFDKEQSAYWKDRINNDIN